MAAGCGLLVVDTSVKGRACRSADRGPLWVLARPAGGRAGRPLSLARTGRPWWLRERGVARANGLKPWTGPAGLIAPSLFDNSSTCRRTLRGPRADV